MSTNPLEQPKDEIEEQVLAVLASHDQDARAVIATLLLDCGHLRTQLNLTSAAISRGFTRGWLPQIERG